MLKTLSRLTAVVKGHRCIGHKQVKCHQRPNPENQHALNKHRAIMVGIEVDDPFLDGGTAQAVDLPCLRKNCHHLH